MEGTMDFKQWAEKWLKENDTTKTKVTTSDINFLGVRLRKAIDAVFGFEDCEKVESMYDNVEINDVFPDLLWPLDPDDKKTKEAVLAEVERMPKEDWPPRFAKKANSIYDLMKKNKATEGHLANLEEKDSNDVKALEQSEKAKDTIKRRDKEIERLKEELIENPCGKEPIFEKVGDREGKLFDFLLKNIGRGGSLTPYSYADIQKGHWEKVDINHRKVLFRLVRKLCKKKGWHIGCGFDDFIDNRFDLEDFYKKLFLPQIYRCMKKADKLSNYFTQMIDPEVLESNDQFLKELDAFKDIDKQLDQLLEKTEAIYTPFIDRYKESHREKFPFL